MGRSRKITDEQILLAAREVFLAEGFGASTLEIARREGISEGSIFKRFKTKEALFFTAMGVPKIPPWIESLQELLGQGDLKENLVFLSLQILEFLWAALPRAIMIRSRGGLLPGMGGSEPPPLRRDTESLAQFLEQESKLGRIRPCNTATIASVILGTLTHYVLSEVMTPPLPPGAPSDGSPLPPHISGALLGSFPPQHLF
jgi:AcrR family transcriptional regulator